MFNRDDGYYWIFFGFMLFIFFYISFLFVDKLHLWSASIGIFASILVFIIIIIPVTKYLSDQIMKFILDKKIHERNEFKFFIILMIIVPIAITSLEFYNEFREKSLTTVLGHQPTEVESFEFRLDGSEGWENNNDEVFKELFNFLSQYKIGKIRDSEWNSDVSKETSFSLIIYTKSDITIVSIHEDRLSLRSNRNGGYYSVLNGPINLEWIENFNQKYD